MIKRSPSFGCRIETTSPAHDQHRPVYKVARHAPALRTRLTSHGHPQSCLQSALAPSDSPLACLNCLESASHSTAAPMAGLRDQHGCPAKGAQHREVKASSRLTSARSSPRTLNRPILPSTKSSAGFVISSSPSQDAQTHHFATTGEAPPEALYKPHSLGELHFASRSRCSWQCHAE